ncbi:MAG: diacylglycerol kinase family lipid kinase [Acidobacteria bacterium]|nr:diacylglycerol kinase family lipid kinase [Acidobacteriota bacterium]
MTTCAVINPASAGGRAGRVWPAIERRLGLQGLEVRITREPGEAAELTRFALKEGFDRILAVGGDGTVNEVVNGFFQQDVPVNPAASLALVPIGTGGDFKRSLNIGGVDQAIEVLRHGHPRPVDVGRLRYRDYQGQIRTRFFINVVSFGMGGEVAARAKNFLSSVSGKAAFFWATGEVFLRYTPKIVELRLDGEPAGTRHRILNIAIGNGRFHGGGMHVCPRARLDDGLLEVTVIEALGMYELARDIKVLYSDNLYVHPKTRHFHAKSIAADAQSPVSIEVDGEPLGTLPVEVSLIPKAISVWASS